MEKEKYILKTLYYYYMDNKEMELKMEIQKSIIIVENYYLMENIIEEKNGMETYMKRLIKIFMN